MPIAVFDLNKPLECDLDLDHHILRTFGPATEKHVATTAPLLAFGGITTEHETVFDGHHIDVLERSNTARAYAQRNIHVCIHTCTHSP